ncbi:MAG: hypothetical protein H6978_12680 [Gammaproteobacteria bacterium]|nr:hypothetical protein [Gammaproteobacteria bacterium]
MSRPVFPQSLSFQIEWRAISACLLLMFCMLAVAQETEQRSLQSLFASEGFRYDSEYPALQYASEATANPVHALQQRLSAGDLTLEFNPVRGYLDAVLAALDISPASQVLVFSRTSLQNGRIRASTPRAIYFNDETYVAWVQESDLLEIATMDAELGPVFYTLPMAEGSVAPFEKHNERCLRCHDTYSLSGGGVPRFLMGSGYIDMMGNQMTHEGWILTDDRTKLRYRWGGWYVTGQHGDQVHLGNLRLRDVQQLSDMDAIRNGNLDSLQGLFNTTPYLTDKSDIVALMVLEHQTHVQNAISRANFDSRQALATDADLDIGALSPETLAVIAAASEPLVQALLMVEEAELTAPVSGNSGFREAFEARGPRDSAGRSLREMDLTTRMFKYPLSYQIYSDAFNQLPPATRTYVYRRLGEVLRGEDISEPFARLTAVDRETLDEILRATKPAYAAALAD